MQVLISCLMLPGAIGLILNESSSIPPKIYTFDHVRANFGVQLNEEVSRTAPLVAIDPCVVTKNTDDLVGVIALVEESENCSYFEQARIIANQLGGVGMVLGFVDSDTPYQMVKYELNNLDVDIPCVSITMTNYIEVKNLLATQSISVTISSTGEKPFASDELEFSFAQITDFIILFHLVWGILTIKWCCERFHSKLKPKMTRAITNRKIQDILYSKDSINVNQSNKRVVYLTNDCCPICLEDFQEHVKLKRLPCGHGFHKDCILPWIADHSRDSCPFCRQRISEKLNEMNVIKSTFCCYCYRCISRTDESSADQEYISPVQLSSFNNASTLELNMGLHFGVDEDQDFQPHVIIALGDIDSSS